MLAAILVSMLARTIGLFDSRLIFIPDPGILCGYPLDQNHLQYYHCSESELGFQHLIDSRFRVCARRATTLELDDKTSREALGQEHRPRRIAQTLGYFAVLASVGLIKASLGPTLLGLVQQTQTDLSSLSLVFTTRSLGDLLGSLLGGHLYDRVPGHWVMAAGLCLSAALMSLVPHIRQASQMAVLFLLLGLSSQSLLVGAHTLMVRVHGSASSPYTYALEFFGGLGALLAPMIVAHGLRTGSGISWSYQALAILLLPGVLWLLSLGSPSRRTPSQDSIQDKRRSIHVLVLICLFFFLSVGAMASFHDWIFSYAIALDMCDEIMAAYLNSGYWVAVTLGRLLAIPAASHLKPRTLLLCNVGGCIAALCPPLARPESLTALWIATLGMGLAAASIPPGVVSLTRSLMKLTGRTSGWLYVGAAAGSMWLPWLIGQFFESQGAQVVMLAVLLDLVAGLAVLAAIPSYSARTA